MFASMVAKHNLSFSLSDHFTKMGQEMFPDSKIAQKFSAARTKTAAIIKGRFGVAFSLCLWL